MKWIAVSVLAAMLIASAIWQNIFLDKFSYEMSMLCDEVQSAVTEDDFSGAQNALSHLTEKWDEYSKYLGALVEHSEIDNIEEKLRSVEWGIIAADDKQLPVYISQLRYYFAHVHMVDAFSLRNIF